MEKDLIVTGFDKIDGEMKQTVNLRDVHVYLGSKQDFSDWIKNRIKQGGFIEDIDFTLHKIMERGKTGAQRKKEYFGTFEMAKELCMMERNEKGKQARQYFIECERRFKQSQIALMEKTDHKALIRRTKELDEQFGKGMDKLNKTIETVDKGFVLISNKVDDMEERLHAVERMAVLKGSLEPPVKKEGLVGFMEENLPDDKYAAHLFTDMEDEYNNIRNFIRVFCVIEKGCISRIKLLYKVYTGWCYKNFMLPLGRNTFYNQFIEILKPFTHIVRKGSITQMHGIRLRRDVLDANVETDHPPLQ